jgi:hypothetical protein
MHIITLRCFLTRLSAFLTKSESSHPSFNRWILKSNYLASCIEAGKFLYEEPFEWFGTGISDGKKINLEAPRKWRILRQQMRHGAFYGMQIIVYGQLILPTLVSVLNQLIYKAALLYFGIS